MAKKKRILVLITERLGGNDRNWDFFRDSLAAALPSDVEVVMGELMNLTFEVDASGDKVYDREKGFSLDDFDLVVFRFIRRELARAASCASFLKARNIPYIDTQIQPGHWSKYSSQVLRFHAGLAPIASVFSNSKELMYMIENACMPFSYPMIVKDVQGRKGRLNFIAHTKDEALTTLSSYPDTSFIIQEFIENDGDYRILVIGGEAVLAIWRQAAGESHLNNTSQGALAEVVDLSSLDMQLVENAKLAARLENLQIAGVDVFVDKRTSRSYIIEVNSSPQLATGAAPKLKMKAYADYLYGLVTPVKG